MACWIGSFMKFYYHKIHKLGGKVFLKPDGHEFLRDKWLRVIRKYWKVSEQMMMKWSDLVICDSKIIEQYIHDCYDGKGIKGRSPRMTFIAYGAEARKSKLADNDKGFFDWYAQNGLNAFSYYLIVGRFVSENNYEMMIREFILSNSKRDFAIITNVNEKFLDELEKKPHFKKDK